MVVVISTYVRLIARYIRRHFGQIILVGALLYIYLKFRPGYGNKNGTIDYKPIYRIIESESDSGTHTKMWMFPKEYIINGSRGIQTGSAAAIEWVQSILNFRKLVLFAVNDINGRLLALGKLNIKCFKYWVNPLSIEEVEEVNLNNSDKLIYTIQFRIQPGNIHFKAVIEKNTNKTYLYQKFGKQRELRLVSAEILDQKFGNPANCLAASVNSTDDDKLFLNRTCLCRNSYPVSLFKKTVEIRKLWNITDVELLTWPPDAPMFVTNYISFGRKELYLHTPRNTFTRYCNSKLKMIIMVSSAPTHFSYRQTIRQTYGNRTLLRLSDVDIIFLFGKVTDPVLEVEIEEEIIEFDDIVLADFIDAYHNLTLSHLSMYNWFYTFCEFNSRNELPKWIFKADDDFLLNVKMALQIANANPNVPLLGYSFCSTSPVRDVGLKKYYVPKYMYAPDWYVCYMSGVTYLVQTKWIPQFLQASLTTPIIHMDDAYMTGLLAYQIGVCPTAFPQRSQHPLCSNCNIKETITLKAIGVVMLEHWKELIQSHDNGSAHTKTNLVVTKPESKSGCLF